MQGKTLNILILSALMTGTVHGGAGIPQAKPEVVEEKSQSSDEKPPSSQQITNNELPMPGKGTADFERTQDFEDVIDNIIPMTPEQIKILKKELDDQRRAAAEPVRPTIPRSIEVLVEPRPGAEIPTIKANRGMVSTLVFLDRHGEPWPISNIRNGNARDFTVEGVTYDNGEEEQVGMTNALTVITNNYSQGNVSVFLANMNTPILFNLESGGEYTDVRVDMRINKMGPVSMGIVQTESGAVSTLPDYDSLMLSLAGGVPPSDYTYDVLDNRIGEVYRGDDRTFLRSHFQLISPGPKDNNMVKSADGTFVYELPDTPVVIMMINGEIKRVRLN